MLHLILSDWHRENPVEFIKVMRACQNIEKVICLGDYDSPEVLEQVLEMDVPKLVIPGNHDYPYMRDSLLDFAEEDVMRPDYLIEDISPEKYKENLRYWKKSAALKKFAMHWLKEIDEEKRFVASQEVELRGGAKKKAGFVHGGLFNYERLEDEKRLMRDERPYQLWERLVDTFTGTRLVPSAIENNLLRMKELKFWLLFKGHDHTQRLFSLGMDENPIGNYKEVHDHLNPLLKMQLIHLDENRRYLVSIGNFSLGDYAVWNDDTQTIRFYSTGKEQGRMKVVPESFFRDH